jgi:hypothetical protein
VIPVPVPIPFGVPGKGGNLKEALGEILALREAVGELQRRLEKQAVLLRALFALLQESQGLTEAEVLDRFRQVEAQKASAPAKKCSQCGRAVNLRTHRCMYCSAACEVESAFDLLELGAWPSLALQPSGSAFRPAEEQGITRRPGD